MKALRLIGIGAVLGGIAWWITYQIKLSKKLIFGFQNIKFRELNKNKIVFGLDLTVKNTTELDVNVRGVDLDVFANGVYITTVFSNVEVNIAPFKTADVPVVVQFDPKQIFGSMGEILFGATTVKDMQITLKGKIKVRKMGIPIPIPFEFTSKIKDWM